MNELVIVNQIPAIWETMKAVLNGEDVTAIAALMGIGGVSIRDFGNIKNFKKIFTRYKEEFPEGFQSEEQESIFYDTFIELSEFIKKEDKNIDGKVFEKISNMLISGIKKKDILTKEYIKIVMNLSWLDLSVLLNLKNITSNVDYMNCPDDEDMPIKKKVTYDRFLKDLKSVTSYPQELIDKAIIQLKENKLIYDIVIEKDMDFIIISQITTELGDKIKELIEGTKTIEK